MTRSTSNARRPSPAAPALPDTLRSFTTPSGETSRFHSLPVLTRQYPNIARLPVCLRIVLEALLRHCDGRRVLPAHVAQLANWQPRAPRTTEIPFVVARVVLQDFTGVPLLADLAAMRDAAAAVGADPARIEPRVPVDLVVDHSVMVDDWGREQSLDLNMKLEFQRNHERYAFMKWGMQAFDSFGVVPPGFGIVHQVNLEYLARGVHRAEPVKGGEPPLTWPDTLVGTDSHTTMINGLGVVGWGVGGIEAESAMLGQPVQFLTPDVVGFELRGELREGVTATDLVLTITEQLRAAKVVGKFVEFFGKGVRALSLPDRATIANMAPEYGATMGFFAVDTHTVDYLQATGRRRKEVERFEAYYRAQNLFGTPRAGEIDYSEVLVLDLATVAPSLAGPRRPQDRVEIGAVAGRFDALLAAPAAQGGYGLPPEAAGARVRTDDGLDLGHGDVLIAAITSCTNTSNPGVMLAAGLLAKKAVQAGLRVAPHIKTSLAPGSRIVTEYLERAGLLPYLQQLGFHVAAYGCTTCIGNSGDLSPAILAGLRGQALVGAAVLSGNRNFEARIHPAIQANYLASPPLVVAYALAGSMRRDLMTEPVGHDASGAPVWLGDIWPTSAEVQKLMKHALRPRSYRDNYARVQTHPGSRWAAIAGRDGATYDWPASSYIARPPFLAAFDRQPAPAPTGLQGARVMALFADSITTDHISPAGNIAASSPAGRWLQDQGVGPAEFNSYGARRGHHDVMVRGTFANVRIKNLMLPPAADGSRVEGGFTLVDAADGTREQVSIHAAALGYQATGTPTVIFAGEEYGTGSSRDWAAKGTALLGIRAVIAASFERIHRSNLVGMGVLPLQFPAGVTWQRLGLDGTETVDIAWPQPLAPQSPATLQVRHRDGRVTTQALTLRVDTPVEAEYLAHGGILPYVLRQLLAE